MSQLNKYGDLRSWNWRNERNDLASFIEHTLQLLMKDEQSISSVLGLPRAKCSQCNSNIGIDINPSIIVLQNDTDQA